ncbi:MULTISPECIES: LysR family transcriptional regulator [Burkholderia]|uniref:LysR family transcriptional regulator n=1 Tax=Burkholderia TaxID=32008 RepID=UPI000BBD1F04|nr:MULTISPECIES: LysR family transcriptional regulator [Burkholderia]ATF84816.1 LysR family transcriptional regulator [Burkholderia gladioli pv. gladioli]MBJ9661388.1 LysR family transcriptional regulator [Burkholderia gladioli]MBJ9715093.1 LysR family transcriptional regulator [Burkholderia gladioli]MBU9154147.1 LysR family transcriptional regulator [Burkholderia gladioli]MBU9215494.1 LysR family transcriptional regulator [Burkholderia gladioli]
MQKSTTEMRRINWDDLRYFLAVARLQTASAAARRLGVDHTTVARRVRELEASLEAVLFEKSRAGGFVLTSEGQRLLAYADEIETAVQSASEQFKGGANLLSGHVRIGSTEGFGSFFLAPQLAHFARAHPEISIDLLPVPHFVSLSKREADLAILLERPERGQYVHTKLCDYRLQLYGTRDYLRHHPVSPRLAELREHAFLNYVTDLVFSPELLYLERTIPGAGANLSTTSIVAQYHAALQGTALAILPCFMAAPDERLVPVFPGEVAITRHFWLCCREDIRNLRRISALWDFLRESAVLNREFLLGEAPAMRFTTL